MVYGCNFNLFFKTNTELTNQEKISKLEKYAVGDMLALLRNIEESPYEYDKEIIDAVYSCLYTKGILCV